jgi:hypothetical protein
MRHLRAAWSIGMLALLPALGTAQDVDPTLRLPSGWSDSFFERLDEGRSPKTVVAVMDFTGGQVLEERLRFRMSDMVLTPLVKAGRFTVVERERLDALMAEQNLGATVRVDPATAARVGKILGAELVVFGTVTQASDQTIDKFAYDLVRVEVTVEVRAVNTTSGTVVISETAAGMAEDRIVTTADGEIVSGPTDYDPLYLKATTQALDEAARLVATTAPLIGFVVAIRNADVIVDLGEERGVRPGDRFVAFRRGDALVHPVTKERIGWEKTVLAELEIVATEAQLATGQVRTVVDSDVAIAPGDLVMYAVRE